MHLLHSKCQHLPVSNQSRPLASRRQPSVLLPRPVCAVSNQSRPLASRRQSDAFLNAAWFRFPINRVPQRVGDFELSSNKYRMYLFPINRVPQRVGDPIRCSTHKERHAFPINRVPQRVGDRADDAYNIRKCCFQSIASPSEQEIQSGKAMQIYYHVSNQSRPLASRRQIDLWSLKRLLLSFQSIASPSEQENHISSISSSI